MSNSIPMRNQIGNLPEGWSGNAQDLLTELESLLQVFFPEDYSVFKSGPTPPANTEHIWLKDGFEWQYFNTDSGSWEALAIDERYRFIYVRANDPFAGVNPDPPREKALWIRTNAATHAVEYMGVWFNGSWRTILDISVAAESTRLATLNSTYPVGSGYINYDNGTNPAVLMSWPASTWVAAGQGRVLLGAGTGSGLTPRVAGETNGAETVTLTAAQSGLPSHSHQWQENIGADFSAFDTGVHPGVYDQSLPVTLDTGPSTAQNAAEAHTNMQPYLAVYMWRRTA